jgi:pimeloyl-ACP methyl ester carboxylesterase
MNIPTDNSLPLVLLPGTGCNAMLWTDLLPLLPPFVQPIIPDLLACESLTAMLDKIAEVPHQQFALLGFSMGGFLAQAFYAKFPERVSQLILVCCTGEGYSAAYREKRLATIAKYEADPKWLTSEKNMALFLSPDHLHDALIKHKLIAMLETVGVETVVRQMRITLQRDCYYEQLEQCKVPRLVIGARYDQIAAPTVIEKLATVLSLQPQWLDCGHMAPLEAPEELGAILTSWFDSI